MSDSLFIQEFLEIQRELKLRILKYCAVEKVYLDRWPELFRATLYLYMEILTEKKIDVEKKDVNYIPMLIACLEEILEDKSRSGIEISEEVREFILQVLKDSGVSFFQSLLDPLAKLHLSDKNSHEVKYLDQLSTTLSSYLKTRLNIYAIDRNNWPILTVNAVSFLKQYTPPISEERQKLILNEVIVQIILDCLPIKDRTTEQNLFIKQCLKPTIDSLYGIDPFFAYRKDKTKNISNDKCCIIC